MLEQVGVEDVMTAMAAQPEVWVAKSLPALREVSALLQGENVRRALEIMQRLGFVLAREVTDQSQADFRVKIVMGSETVWHGPYASRDTAGVMGHRWARRESNQGASSVTYQVFDGNEPVSRSRRVDQHWVQQWPGRPRRRCDLCGKVIVHFSAGWVVDDGSDQDGVWACPYLNTPEHPRGHMPAPKETRRAES